MDLTIAKKLALAFGLVLSLTLGVGWYGLSELNDVRTTTQTIAEHDFHALDLVRRIGDSQDQMKILRERTVSQYLLGERQMATEDPRALQARWEQALSETETLLRRLEAAAAEYEQEFLSVVRRDAWRNLRRHAGEGLRRLQLVDDEVQQHFELITRGELLQLPERWSRLEALRTSFDENIEQAAGMVLEMVRLGGTVATDSYESARTSILLALALALVLGSVSAVGIHMSVTRPLGAFMALAERVGEGDLSQTAPVRVHDELGRLGQSLNAMVAGLKELAARTRATTEELNAASSEILASTQEQSASTSEQSAAVQQTTSTMEEVNLAALQVVERAQRVAAAAEATSASSQAGMKGVQEMTRAMQSIREQAEIIAENIVALSERTQAVGEIITTVNDIAEQSNLLALNASIEAAAEGGDGHRFGVVAREMKYLAGQAKEATVQVRSILGDIQKGINTSVMQTEEAVKRVASGAEQSKIVESTILELAGGVEESVRAFEQIVASANQQRIGFEQVVEALKNVRESAEQNAAGTRQLEQAAANLAALSSELRKSAERYNL